MKTLKDVMRFFIKKHLLWSICIGLVCEFIADKACALIAGTNIRKKRAHILTVDQTFNRNNTVLSKEQNNTSLICNDTELYGCWSIILTLFCLVLILYCCCWQINRRCSRDTRRLGNSTEDCC